MKNLIFRFSLVGITYAAFMGSAFAQLGIGTSLPQARLHVYGGSFLAQTPALDPQLSPFYDPVNFDTDPVYHGFKWIHEKGAFRASGTGAPSIAFESANAAKYSFAAGFDTFAAFGFAPSVFGMRSSASGSVAFAIGEHVISNDDFSFAQGNHSNANGPSCVTLGTNLENNFQVGAFIMGHTDFNAQSTGNHQIKMLFDGGYRLFSNGNVNIGVALNAGGNAWSIISDVNKKENFEIAKGKAFLSKIASMPFSSWNYKGQDPKLFRHYGPMAQDFFKAFGKDSYGIIGSDTAINQADLNGVTLIAIKALVEETNELLKMNEDLKIQLIKLHKQVSKN